MDGTRLNFPERRQEFFLWLFEHTKKN